MNHGQGKPRVGRVGKGASAHAVPFGASVTICGRTPSHVLDEVWEPTQPRACRVCVRAFETDPIAGSVSDNTIAVTIRLRAPRFGEAIRGGVIISATLVGLVGGGPSGALVAGAIAAVIAFRMGAEVVIGLALACLALTAAMNVIGQRLAEEALASDAFLFLAAGATLSLLNSSDSPRSGVRRHP